MSNLRQIHLGFQMYGDDNGGEAPYCPHFDGSLGSADCQAAFVTGYPTGWQIVIGQGYVKFDVLECPSQGWKPNMGVGAPGLHYSYRYNSNRVLNYFDNITSMPRCYDPPTCTTLVATYGALLFAPARSKRILLGDALTCRRDNSYQIVTENDGYYRREWAHRTGGYVARHNGNVAWLPNDNNDYPQQWYSGGKYQDYDTYLGQQ